jgi:hypothetical protein
MTINDQDAPYRAPAIRSIDNADDLDQIEDDGHELDGTDPTADNVRRASFAAQAVMAYAEATGNHDLDTVISDLMGDMQHLLDVLSDWDDGEGLGDIGYVVGRGTEHYQAEIRGEF